MDIFQYAQSDVSSTHLFQETVLDIIHKRKTFPRDVGRDLQNVCVQNSLSDNAGI